MARAETHHPDAGKSPEELERELEATRGDIESTLEELGNRLSPGQLVDQTLSYLRDTGAPEGARTFARNLGATVRDNPVPLLVAAGGLAWLAAASSDSSSRRAEWDARWDEPAWPAGGGSDDDEESTLEQLKSKVADTAEGARERSTRTLSNARDGATRLGSQLSAGERELRRTARRGAARSKETWSWMLEEQPLLLGLAGVALGALVGGGLPPSRREDEMLGEVRDETLAAAAEHGRRAAKRVREQVDEASDAGSSRQHSAHPAVGSASSTGSDPAPRTREGEPRRNLARRDRDSAPGLARKPSPPTN